MTGEYKHNLIKEIQLGYANYYMRNRKPPNRLLMHKSLASWFELEFGYGKSIGQVCGSCVIPVEDEDLFSNGMVFRWISVVSSETTVEKERN